MIELLIVIGITMLLAGVSSVVYGNLQTSTQLNETASQVAQNLRLVKEQSISGFNNTAHGIKFETSRYTLYQGDSYATRDSSYDRIYSFASALNVSTTLINNEINFSKGVGVFNATGTVIIDHLAGGTKIIFIDDNGMIKEQ